MKRYVPARRAGWVMGLMVWALVWVLGCGLIAEAWGQSLTGDGGERMLRMPSGDLAYELDRLGLVKPAGVVANTAQAAEVGPKELRAALRAEGMGEPDADRVLRRYTTFREAMSAAKESRPDRWAGTVVEARRRGLMGLEVPRGLPVEFELYLRGALAWAKHDTAGARAAWRELLALPAEARRYRGVWAAYMLGMTHVRGLGAGGRGEGDGGIRGIDAQAARGWFAETRRLALAGSEDSLGLSAASLGWEARIALAVDDPAEAVRLYALQYAAGDRTASVSLRVAVSRLLALKLPGHEGHEAVIRRAAPAAADPVLRRVVTAVLVSWQVRGGGLGRPRGMEWAVWLPAVTRFEAAGGRLMEAELSRLAWLAYSKGVEEQALPWWERAVAAERAGRVEASVVTAWLGAKLSLQAGDLDGAAAGMQRVVAALPLAKADGGLRAGGERFVVRRYGRGAGAGEVLARQEAARIALARGRYGEALGGFVSIGYRTDAAYVAEQVMGVDELRTWVDEHQPGEGAPQVGMDGRGLDVRGLLGRRLMRLGRYAEAERYLPEASREVASRLAGWMSVAGDEGRPASERAEAYWEAACLMKHEGNAVLRSWSVRDFRKGDARREDSVQRGPGRSVGWSRLRSAVRAGVWVPAGDAEPEATAGWWAGRLVEGDQSEAVWRARPGLPRADELERLRRHRGEWAVEQSRAFRAAGLAWEGAALMEDGSDELARRLCVAGTWIALRDPQRADRFYQALVQRCGDTAIGQRAAAMRWLPRLREDPDFAIK